MHSRSTVAALVALAVSALLAACGGSSHALSASEAEQASEQKAEAKLADYARCLREHGIDAQLAARPGGGHGLAVGPGDAGSEAARAASAACARYRAAPERVNVSPQEKVEMEERTDRWSRCMREHGVELEVRASGNTARMLVGGRRPNPESPAFQRALSVCGGPKPTNGS